MRCLDFWHGVPYIFGMETIAIPITLLISVATFLITVGGVWFVTQKRVRDLEFKTIGHDKKHEQIISEIGSLRTEMNAEISSLRTEVNAEISSLRTDMNAEISDVKVEIARMQGSVMVLSEKFDLFIQGRLIPATPNVSVGGA